MATKSGRKYLEEVCSNYRATEEEVFSAIASVDRDTDSIALAMELLKELYEGATTTDLSEKWGIPTKQVYGKIVYGRQKMCRQLFRNRHAEKELRTADKAATVFTVEDFVRMTGADTELVTLALEHPEMISPVLSPKRYSIGTVRRYLSGVSVETLASDNVQSVETTKRLINRTMVDLLTQVSNAKCRCADWGAIATRRTPSSVAAEYGITLEQFSAAVDKCWQSGYISASGYKLYESWAERKSAVAAAKYSDLCITEIAMRMNMVLSNVARCVAQMYPQATAAAMEMSSDMAVQRSVQSDQTVRG